MTVAKLIGLTRIELANEMIVLIETELDTENKDVTP